MVFDSTVPFLCWQLNVYAEDAVSAPVLCDPWTATSALATKVAPRIEQVLKPTVDHTKDALPPFTTTAGLEVRLMFGESLFATAAPCV